MTREERFDRMETSLSDLESANDEMAELATQIERQSMAIEEARSDLSDHLTAMQDNNSQPTRCFIELPNYSFDRCCRITGHEGECLPFTQIIGVRTA